MAPSPSLSQQLLHFWQRDQQQPHSVDQVRAFYAALALAATQ
jgi:hypothetical protein